MKRNFAYTVTSVGSRLVVSTLLFLLLARLWGPADFGLFVFVFSAAALVVLLVDFGFAVYVMREVGADPLKAAEVLADSASAKLLMTLPALAAAVVGCLILGPATLPVEIATPLFLAAVVTSFSEFFVAPMRALGRYDLETWVVAASNAIYFLLAGTIAWMGASVSTVAWAMLAGRITFLVLALVAILRVVPKYRLSERGRHGPVQTLRRVLPYGVDNGLTSIWNQLDVIAVQFLFGNHGVGLYAAGQKIVMGVAAMAPVVGNVMIPRLSRMAACRDKDFIGNTIKTSAMMWTIGMAFGLPLMLLPDFFVGFLFGDRYSALAELLPFFGLVILIKFIGGGAGVVVTAAGLQSRRVVAQLVGLTCAACAIAVVAVTAASLKTFVLAIALSISATAATLYLCLRSYLRDASQWQSQQSANPP